MATEQIFQNLGIPFLVALFGAVIAYSFGARTRRHTLQTDQLRENGAAMATSARQLLHLLSSTGKRDALAIQQQAASEQAIIRSMSDLLTLVGDKNVQSAARLVRHHSFAVVCLIHDQPDPRPEYSAAPYERLEWAIESLMVAARRQLGLRGSVVSTFDLSSLTADSKLDHESRMGQTGRRARSRQVMRMR